MSEFDDFDEVNYPRPVDTDFNDILERAMSRRDFLKTNAAFGVSAFVAGSTAFSTIAVAKESVFSFKPVAATVADTITVPDGYSWQVVASWGDRLFSNGVPFDQVTRGTGESQELALGDNNDGMHLFPLGDNHGVFVVNNEYVNRNIILPNGVQNADDVRKSKAGHGVSVFEIEQKEGKWQVVIDGKLNRRITADTPTQITGPARGHDLMKTKADPDALVSHS